MLSTHSNMISKQFLYDLAYGDGPFKRNDEEEQPTASYRPLEQWD